MLTAHDELLAHQLPTTFDHVEQDDIAQLLHRRQMRQRAADLSRTDECDLGSGHCRGEAAATSHAQRQTRFNWYSRTTRFCTQDLQRLRKDILADLWARQQPTVWTRTLTSSRLTVPAL